MPKTKPKKEPAHPSRPRGLSASQEDYLEVIYHLVAENHVARGKDIARRLGVSSASVTGALQSLAERHLVNYAPYEAITLTPQGKKFAENIVRRHQVLSAFFVNVLRIEKEEAEESACKLEHVISETVLERFSQFAEFLETCPRGGFEWIERFGYYCEHGLDRESCKRCMSLRLQQLKHKKWTRKRT
jgi:DtxR family Mn-dependent transcriptional regulator